MSAQPSFWDSRDPRRLFTPTQKQKMALRDGLVCAQCGIDLDLRDAHGAHVDAHSLGGPTDISNGVLLCESCNLTSGINPPVRLRAWQRGFHAAFLSSDDPFFMLAACPGAGKTIAVKSLLRKMRERGEIGGVLIGVPTKAVGFQWADDYLDMAIGMYDERCRIKSADFFGMAITYQMLAGNPGVFLREIQRIERETGAPVQIVLDEMHHLGDQMAWGEAANVICHSRQVLGLSGTPWRSGGEPIPCVQYDDAGLAIVDFDYTLGEALLDGGVLRRPRLEGIDGQACIIDIATAAVETVEISGDLPDRLFSPALRSALKDDSDVLRMMLERASLSCDAHRAVSPYQDNAILVVAQDKKHAESIARVIRSTYGETPVVVHSDVDDSLGELARAKTGNRKWIVAVQMIAEGVDINRISVIVYATNKATKMYWMQVVGRALRLRTKEDIDAVIIYPEMSVFNQYAAEIENMIPEALRAVPCCEKCGRAGWKICPDCRDDDGGEGPPITSIPVLPAENAELGSVRIAGEGESISGADVQAAQLALLKVGLKPVFAQEVAAHVARMRQGQDASVEISSTKRAPQRQGNDVANTRERVEALRKELSKRVRKVAMEAMVYIDVRDPAQKKQHLSLACKLVNIKINDRFGLRKAQREKLTEQQLRDAIVRCENGEFDLEPGWADCRG